MLLVYTHQITNRVRYTFNLIFKSVLGVDCEITSDMVRFKQYEGPKISYTSSALSNELFFKSDDLLFDKGIRVISDIPQDLFAMTFFLTTRYEEYWPFKGDKFGRFNSKLSLQHKNNLLQKPLVNIKAQELKQLIQDKYRDFIFPVKSFSCIPTIDIDTAYAYKGRSIIRTLGGYLKDLTKLHLSDLNKRTRVLQEKENDPYDTYELQFQIQKKYNLNPVYFFLLADKAKYDKNLSFNHRLMQSLIKHISIRTEIGLHPSFESNRYADKVFEEKKRLEQISQIKITKSKQHFLILKFPDTYRNLIACGITDDYTMGYADVIGFRAGICNPYYWYDLEKEEQTQLCIHPFSVMDGTLRNYLYLSVQQAIEAIKEIIREVKNVNGEFSFIWHNETFSDWNEWKGWKGVYEEIIAMTR